MNMTFLRCVRCGAEQAAVPTATVCGLCGSMLDVVYDYQKIKQNFSKNDLKNDTDSTMWRYKPLLPVADSTILPPLRVGGSPLYRGDRLAAELGMTGALYIKDDGLNPTSSLKDRASAMAVAKATEAGADTICCASTGNAASSLAGNAAAAGLKSVIFVPERAPAGKVAQLRIFGAEVTLVKGDYGETFRQSAACIEQNGYYNRNAAINPYLLEGKKTVSFEICEQLGWQAPDFLAVSVGDGCTIAGVWKGLRDLFEIGFIDKLPRLISVQAAGCCPLNRAFESGEPWQPSAEDTIADSIAVGVPRNADKALAAMEESHAIPVNVTDDEILAAMAQLGRTQGIFGEPAGVAATAGVKKALQKGLIPRDATVVTIVTGNGLKDTANAARASQTAENA